MVVIWTRRRTYYIKLVVNSLHLLTSEKLFYMSCVIKFWSKTYFKQCIFTADMHGWLSLSECPVSVQSVLAELIQMNDGLYEGCCKTKIVSKENFFFQIFFSFWQLFYHHQRYIKKTHSYCRTLFPFTTTVNTFWKNGPIHL